MKRWELAATIFLNAVGHTILVIIASIMIEDAILLSIKWSFRRIVAIAIIKERREESNMPAEILFFSEYLVRSSKEGNIFAVKATSRSDGSM